MASSKLNQIEAPKYPVKLPEIPPGVVPTGVQSAIAQDSNIQGYGGSYFFSEVAGFPGYPYLAMLQTRAEYRAMASALATELTREWITLNSSETAGEGTKKKVTELTQKLKDIGLQQVIQRAAEHDAYFGRAQIYIDLKGHNPSKPLILSPKTIARDSFVKVATVEAMWTTPNAYNSIDPAAKDFYKPSKWWMLGKEVHSSRLLTVVTRPVSDMLKPAFNFGGMSLSQLAEPAVENWLRTRQSVSDLVNNFATIVMQTDMSQVLTDGTDEQAAEAASDLADRADLFTSTKSNRGLLLLDKEKEDLKLIAVPLGGLHELQAQAQEGMCAVSHEPAIVLTGVAPTGFGNVAEGEMRTWHNWIAAQQKNYWRWVIETILKVLQLSMYGEIDPNINFEFVSLYQMTPKEKSEIRVADSTAAANYIAAGTIDAQEDRERLARDPDSGYHGLDLGKEITPPGEGEDEGNDEDA